MLDQSPADRRHLDMIAAARRQIDSVEQRARAHSAQNQTLGAGSSEGEGRVGFAPAGIPAVPLPGLEIIREIHRGGQGVVYQARQHSTGRMVAVKVLREGPFAGRMEQLRLEREADILAELNHRSIVGIIDRGVAAGQYYMVMEFVDGRPIDRHARERDLNVRERLQLFGRVCEAVGAAHLRGVIHRDLKPGNVYVDQAGEPRILDFGLAKRSATGDQSAAPATQTGLFVGSLPWASPEQARGHHDQIDVRSDVYSLGVILYQLLTDRLPYSTAGTLSDVLHRIEHEPPAAPRNFLGRADGDLETIVLKCLSKDPARRYQSVPELAQDVRLYLSGDAIVARRDSGWYLIRHALRRHKLAVGVALGFVTLTTIGLAALSILYRAKSREFARAETERAQAVVARDAAEKAAAKADAVTNFLRDMLSSADPNAAQGGGYQVKVVDVMKRASGEAATKFAGHPEVQVAIRSALGEAYYGLGLYPAAESEFRAGLQTALDAWGDDNDNAAISAMNLCAVLWIQGRFDEAEPLARQAVEYRLRAKDELHEHSINAMTTLAAILNARGVSDEGVTWNQRAYAAARSLYGDDHEHTRSIANNLAFSFDKAGRLSEAEALYRRVIDANQAAGKGEAPDVLVTMQSLASCLRAQGRLDEAESLTRTTIGIRARILPPDHPAQGDGAQALGRILMERHDVNGAAEFFEQALANHEKALPPGSWRIAVTRCDLGRALMHLQRFEESERALLQSHDVLSQTGDHPRQVFEAATALVELYDLWNAAAPGADRQRRAEEWRRRLSELPSPRTSAAASRGAGGRK